MAKWISLLLINSSIRYNIMDKKLLTIAAMSVLLTGGIASAKAAEITDVTATLSTTVSTELPDGTLVKIPGDPKVYVIQSGERMWIRTPEEFKNGGYDWRKIKTVAPERLAKIREKVQELEDLVSDKDGKVYRIMNGKRMWIPDEDAFNAQGCRRQDVKHNDDRVRKYPELRLVKDSRGNIYYITDQGKKKLVSANDAYRCYHTKPEDVTKISDRVIYSLKNDNSGNPNGCNSYDNHNNNHGSNDRNNYGNGKR
jgi:hypothetical protein